MQQQFSRISLIILIVILVVSSLAAMSETTTPNKSEFQRNTNGTNLSLETTLRPQKLATFTTVITINTTVDTSGDNLTATCYYDGSIYFSAADGQCNLRRALVEASHRPPADRPILIQFNLPLTDTNYNSTLDIWTVVMDDAYSNGIDPNTILEPDGLVTIDGNTQPGGRTDGPKIVINSESSLEVYSEQNTLRNLAFNGGGGIFLQESSGVGGKNLVENVWVGLTSDGQTVYIKDEANPQFLAGGGISIFSNDNVLSDTIVTGSNVGIQVQGDNNILKYNHLGTRGDMTVPNITEDIKCLATMVYSESQYYGGWGIQMLSGSNNQIISNTIVALHYPHSPTTTSPPGIMVAGSGHWIAYNTIGLDGNGLEFGTCGQAIDVSGSDSVIEKNLIVNARSSYFDAESDDPTEGAVFINDGSPLFGQITVRDNIVRNSTTKVIEFGPAIPDDLKLFEPARIISIEGTTVTGTNGDDSSCPNCLIDLYLDDLDDEQDAFELLATTVADSQGNFTATLSAPLPANSTIRTTSTTQDLGVIGGYDAGTTTKMSPGYGPDGAFSHQLAPGWNLFSIDVSPADTDIATVLSGLNGTYDVVLSFEGGPAGGGLTYDPTNPGASDLTTIDPLHGYWINITATTTQTLTLFDEPARNDTEITLADGWNLVSYLPDRTYLITEALASIAGDYDAVQGFHDGLGLTYVPGSPEFSDLTEMRAGYGYWIKIKEGLGPVTLLYPPYLAPKPAKQITAPWQPQGVVASRFFTPTTEWADYYGVALLGGHSAPPNAEIIAYDPDGVVAGSFTVHTPGLFGFLHVYADDPRTAADEGVAVGDAVSFTINGRWAEITQGSSDWTGRGALIDLDLSAAVPFSQTTVWADFWGTLIIADQPAPVGTLLAAYDPAGIYVGDFFVEEAGLYGFLHTYGDDGATAGDEGAILNDNLIFQAWLPGSTVPVVVTPESGNPDDAKWLGQGSRTELNLVSTAETTVAPTAITINGPTVGQPNTPYTFTITVDPTDVTVPLSYTIVRTDFPAPQQASLGRSVEYKNIFWTMTGTKVITVTAANVAGSAMTTHTIIISTDVVNEGWSLFLPLILK